MSKYIYKLLEILGIRTNYYSHNQNVTISKRGAEYLKERGKTIKRHQP